MGTQLPIRAQVYEMTSESGREIYIVHAIRKNHNDEKTEQKWFGEFFDLFYSFKATMG